MELRTLGSVRLDAPSRPDAQIVATQPKRFALLVYVALAKPRGAKRRDTLLALLWPDADQERGRQVLRQTIYLLRQSLGRDAIVSHGDEDIFVNDEQVSCDALRFERAIAAGQLAEGLDLYDGDFLDGFHVPDASPDLEEWIQQERRRLRAMASSAAWEMAARDDAARNGPGALYWARRAVMLDRDNEDAIRELMRMHVRHGDRLGAINVFDEHTRRMQREFDAAPSADLVRLSAELRAEGSELPPARPRAEPPSPVALPTVVAVSMPAGAPRADSRRTDRRRRVAIAVGAIIVVGGALLIPWRLHPTPSRAPLLAVGSIVEFTRPDSNAESAVAADLLATSLARLHGIEVIPEVRLYDVQAQLRDVGGSPGLLSAARQAGASQMLRGTLRQRGGGRLTLDGQVLDLASGSVIHAFRAEGADLFELVDDATEKVAVLLGAPPPPVPIRDVTTKSLVAYRLYQEGLRATYFDADARAGFGLFRAALDEDSTFAMAAYYYAITANIAARPETDSLMRRANSLAGRAPDRERLLIRYRIANTGARPEALALAETLSIRYPNDLDAVFARGALLQRAGQWAAAAAQFRRLIEADSLSLRSRSARCVACDAYVELWWTYVYGDSIPAAEALMREALRRQGTRGPLLDLLAVALARQSKYREALQYWHALHDSLSPGPNSASLQRAWVAIRAGDFGTADDTLAHLRATAAPDLRGEAAWYLAISLRNQGRLRDAMALPDGGGLPMIALFEAGRYREAAAIADGAAKEIARLQPSSLPKQLPWNLTHVATALAARGDTMRLSRLADSTELLGAPSNYGRDPLLHHYTRGLLWLARGDTARAADAFRHSIWSWTDGYTRANYELGRALISLHRPAEAIYPLQAALRGDLQSSNMYVTRTELREQLAKAFAAIGQRDSARAEFRLVASAWARADPAFASRRAVAEAYLAQR